MPAVEVKLCGHATLRSAHVLWSETDAGELLPFESRSGILTARRETGLIELDFPASRTQPSEIPVGITEALGINIKYCGRRRNDLILTVKDEATVRGMRPDFEQLRQIEKRGIMVTADVPAKYRCPTE